MCDATATVGGTDPESPESGGLLLCEITHDSLWHFDPVDRIWWTTEDPRDA